MTGERPFRDRSPIAQKSPQAGHKPNSVEPTFVGPGSHVSGPAVARRLVRPTRSPYRPKAKRGGAAPCSQFGLAPGGVCPAGPVARPAVSSYLTISPLPRRLRAAAVSFLWHFPYPGNAGTVAVSHHRAPWSSDFPPRPLRVAAAAGPARRPTRYDHFNRKASPRPGDSAARLRRACFRCSRMTWCANWSASMFSRRGT